MMDFTDDPGFVTARLPEGGAVQVDVARAFYRVCKAYDDHSAAGSEAYLEAVASIMEGFGLPRGSLLMADRFARDVTDAFKALQKKSSGPAGSADSTGSTPEA